MTHHKKLGMWLQLGGHCDGETDLLKVALREAKEDFVSFIKECYTPEGHPIDREFEKNIGKPCDWCNFGKNRELCGAGLAPDEKFFILG